MDLRATFDENAERYEQFRPRYPTQLFDKLVADAGINSNSSLLEIGPGTGQATKPLAKLGSAITAIELGASLAQKARQELRQYDNVRIITGSFEDINLPASNYDLIYSATAFHWVKNEYQFTKTARLLKPHGYLAIIHTTHVSDENGDRFHRASQSIYDTYWPPKDTSSPPVLPAVHEVKAPYVDTALFGLQSFMVFPQIKTYTAHDYAGLVSTYSPTLALPPSKRKNFLAAIEKLINEQFNGKLEKRFAFSLAVARKIQNKTANPF
ncbi:MAG TPA: class I SAM-dependent methyltransferase [Candidatus Saccharimonadales bacterium]|nr:class I SAM-dependent methyltransferase [Candidatus Saccharimonadales bacterium]